MIIQMAEFGRALVTRVAGRSAFTKISKEIQSADGIVTFDFAGVDSITNSFADEVFGRMVCEIGIAEMKERATFKNISPFWARIVRAAMDSRASQQTLSIC